MSLIQHLLSWLKRIFSSSTFSQLYMKSDLSCVYYFPIDAQGNETGESIPITLSPDGTADTSKLPLSMQGKIQMFGVKDPLGLGTRFPKDGILFLHALMHSSNGYTRFRSIPSRTKS